MKAFKSFRGWMHRAFAAIVKAAFPTWAVKCLTLKNLNDSCDFLPGEEKELKAIQKLNLSDEAIGERDWSPDTRLALIKQGKRVIKPQTPNEFNAFLATNPSINEVKDVMRGYTPSSRKLREMMDTWQPQEMVTIIAAYPKYFIDFKPWEILGVEEKKPYYGEQRWDYAIALVNQKAELAPAFMQEVVHIPPHRLCQKAVEAFKAFWDQVYCNPKQDVSELMSYLYVFYPEYYMLIRRRCQRSYELIGSYVAKMLPQLVEYLKDTPEMADTDEAVEKYEAEIEEALKSFTISDGKSLTERAKKVKLNDAIEARLWLDLAINHLGEDAVMTTMFDNWSKIESHVSEDTKKEFYCDVLGRLRIKANRMLYVYQGERISQRAFILDKAMAALKFFSKDLLPELRNFIADNTLADNLPQVKVLFPFSGWEKAEAKKLVRLMARNQELPIERMDELTEELKATADEELEIISELAALKTGNLQELLSRQLYPEAEKEIFGHILKEENLKFFEDYISRFVLSDMAFSRLISTQRNNWETWIVPEIGKLIEVYAKAHKLIVKKYRMLMQSDYKQLAPLMKQYVEGNENLLEDTTNEAETAEQPEENAPNSTEVEEKSKAEGVQK